MGELYKGVRIQVFGDSHALQCYQFVVVGGVTALQYTTDEDQDRDAHGRTRVSDWLMISPSPKFG